jgi:hypothetical protein
MRIMARSSVKIAWQESVEMFTSSAISRMVKQRSAQFFHALERPFIHCGPLKVSLESDRLSTILDPLYIA